MSIFRQPTSALAPRTPVSGAIAMGYAGLLVVMAVAQLFTYEDFLRVLSESSLPLSVLTAYVAGACIVVAEVFALPFLLRMVVSPAFRVLSMTLAVLTAAMWNVFAWWVVGSGTSVETAAFLGALPVAPGWWMVCFSAALGLLAGWSVWGLWPGERR